MISLEEMEANWRIAQQEAGEQFRRAERAEALHQQAAARVAELEQILQNIKEAMSWRSLI